MKKAQLTASVATGSYSVSWQGALRAVHSGDVSGKVEVSEQYRFRAKDLDGAD